MRQPATADLFELQEVHGLSDYRLSALAGYDDSLISRWRREITTPRLPVLGEFAQVFGYEVRLVPKHKEPQLPIYLPKFLPVREL